MRAIGSLVTTARRMLLVGVLRLMVVHQRRADRERWPAAAGSPTRGRRRVPSRRPPVS